MVIESTAIFLAIIFSLLIYVCVTIREDYNE